MDRKIDQLETISASVSLFTRSVHYTPDDWMRLRNGQGWLLNSPVRMLSYPSLGTQPPFLGFNPLYRLDRGQLKSRLLTLIAQL